MEALKYIRKSAAATPKLGMEMDIADVSEIPFFNSDTERDDEKPPALEKLLRQMTGADAFCVGVS